MGFLLGMIMFLGAVALAIAQMAAGFQGIEHHLGPWWGWGALFLAVAFRITIPITIAAFFGAMNVWGWHWALALAFAAPGLALATPGLIAGIASAIRDKWRARSSA